MDFKYNKLMIIDDSDVDTYITNILIKNNKIAKEVLIFENGLKAIEYFETNKNNPSTRPDIIFLDLYMPLVDGFQFLDLLDEIDPDIVKKCKVCILTSSIDNNDIVKSKLYNNIFTFISKPISAEILNSL